VTVSLCAQAGQICEEEKLMDDSDVLYQIEKLVDEEQKLTQLIEQGHLTEDQQASMRQLELYLNQCRDLLRQRRARRQAGLDPADARLDDEDSIENFPQ